MKSLDDARLHAVYTMIGHTIELILQVNGNLKTSSISRVAF